MWVQRAALQLHGRKVHWGILKTKDTTFGSGSPSWKRKVFWESITVGPILTVFPRNLLSVSADTGYFDLNMSCSYIAPLFQKGLIMCFLKNFPFSHSCSFRQCKEQGEKNLQTLLIPDIVSFSSLHKVSRHLISQHERCCLRGFSPNKNFIIKVTINSEQSSQRTSHQCMYSRKVFLFFDCSRFQACLEWEGWEHFNIV